VLSSLPADTDFYSSSPSPPPRPSLPDPSQPLDALLPRLRRCEIVARDARRPPMPVEAVITSRGDELERLLAHAGVQVPEHAEGYAISPLGPVGAETRLVLAARTPLGLLRAAATREMLGGDAGPIVRAEDWPSTGIRFLGGWAFWRAEGLAEAIDITAAFKGNRLLYNGWGWTPADALTQEDALLVRRARERGVELVFELRRMSFGKEYRLNDPRHRRTIVAAYEQAAAAGFRCFGLLFDDVPWETASEECALAREVLDAVDRRLAAAPGRPELYVCPQYYWCPGQMDAAWKGHAGPEETARQRAYLATYGGELPPSAHVYIANYWGDHPAGYAEPLRRDFTELVGRKPIFFDNQAVNDYRHGAIQPFAIHSRPRSFAESYAGYYLNCGPPFAAHAATAATALSFAWNPEAYEPGTALGAALVQIHGREGSGLPPEASRSQRASWPERVACTARGVERLRDLAVEWGGGVFTAAGHYATIWRQIRDGRIGAADMARWRSELRSVREAWLDGLRAPAPRARAASTDGLLDLVRDNHRLEADLGLFAAVLELLDGRCETPRAAREAMLAAELDRCASSALAAVGRILPRAPGLDALLADPESLPPLEAPAWSWVEYFVRNTRKIFRELWEEMQEALRSASREG
jgi:hypothetical protein